MAHLAPGPGLALEYLEGSRPPGPLLAEARRLRDEGRGRTVTDSRKVFVPLTTLCRIAAPTAPSPSLGPGGVYLEPDEVMAVARAGQAHRCTEALFTLGGHGRRTRWPQAPGLSRPPRSRHDDGLHGGHVAEGGRGDFSLFRTPTRV